MNYYGYLVELYRHIQRERGTVKCNWMNKYGKKTGRKYDFKAFGEAIKAARTGRKESRKQVSDEMYISPRYLANIENKGQHPSLQIFFELMLRYNISVDQFLLDTPTQKDTKRRQLDALLDDMSDNGIRIVTATAKEISEVEKEDK